jgi:geranylgeranyl pyrophosphate synthase
LNFAAYLHYRQQQVNEALERCLALQAPFRLREAMRYAVLNGGKRLRPVLVYASGEAVNADETALEAIACAVELVHAYSLIHDDLPVMDDDALRRGRPTCHIAFDEATAVLAGDGLQALAFQLLADMQSTVQPNQQLLMLSILAQAAGPQGMVGGQALDLAAAGLSAADQCAADQCAAGQCAAGQAAASQTVDITYIENMHSLKTGALIRASVTLGALTIEEPGSERLKQLQRYADYAGLAFQIQDDILDIEGHSSITGKQQGKDHQRNKPNYPSISGLAQAKQRVQQLRAQALACLQGFDEKAYRLRELIDYIIQREC